MNDKTMTMEDINKLLQKKDERIKELENDVNFYKGVACSWKEKCEEVVKILKIHFEIMERNGTKEGYLHKNTRKALGAK